MRLGEREKEEQLERESERGLFEKFGERFCNKLKIKGKLILRKFFKLFNFFLPAKKNNKRRTLF